MSKEKNTEKVQNSSAPMVSDETIKNGKQILEEYKKDGRTMWDTKSVRDAKP